LQPPPPTPEEFVNVLRRKYFHKDSDTLIAVENCNCATCTGSGDYKVVVIPMCKIMESFLEMSEWLRENRLERAVKHSEAFRGVENRHFALSWVLGLIGDQESAMPDKEWVIRNRW
jgi:hypothetical protein